MRLTRQGVRDLDQLGGKARRGNVGRPVAPLPCLHEWEPRELDERLAFIYGISTVRMVCRRCGEIRR